MISSLLSFFSIIMSFGALSGIILHDSRLDKAAALAIAPVSMTQYESSKPLSLSEAHTHVERSAFSQAVNTYQTVPAMQPRSDTRRHLMQRYAPKGHHAFDNYNLPLV